LERLFLSFAGAPQAPSGMQFTAKASNVMISYEFAFSMAGSTQNAINFCSFVYIAKSYVYIIEWKSTFFGRQSRAYLSLELIRAWFICSCPQALKLRSTF
jgi:hypothetical protein